MAVTPPVDLSPNEMKVRWQEPYTSEALNQQAVIMPTGIYWGWDLSARNDGSQIVDINADATRGSHVAVVPSNSSTGHKLVARREGDIDLDLSGETFPTFIVLEINYQTGSDTTGQLKTNDSPTADQVILGEVTESGGNLSNDNTQKELPYGAGGFLDPNAIGSGDDEQIIYAKNSNFTSSSNLLFREASGTVETDGNTGDPGAPDRLTPRGYVDSEIQDATTGSTVGTIENDGDSISHSLSSATDVRVSISSEELERGNIFVDYDGSQKRVIPWETDDAVVIDNASSSVTVTLNSEDPANFLFRQLDETTNFDQTFDLSGEISVEPFSFQFDNQGTHLYVLSNSNVIYEYSLGTGWDLSTASYTGNSLDVSVSGTEARDVRIDRDNGGYFYVLQKESQSAFQVDVYEFVTNYDLSTASVVGSITETDFEQALPGTNSTAEPYDSLSLDVSGDSSYLYLMSDRPSKLYTYSLIPSTPSVTYEGIENDWGRFVSPDTEKLLEVQVINNPDSGQGFVLVNGSFTGLDKSNDPGWDIVSPSGIKLLHSPELTDSEDQILRSLHEVGTFEQEYPFFLKPDTGRVMFTVNGTSLRKHGQDLLRVNDPVEVSIEEVK